MRRKRTLGLRDRDGGMDLFQFPYSYCKCLPGMLVRAKGEGRRSHLAWLAQATSRTRSW